MFGSILLCSQLIQENYIFIDPKFPSYLIKLIFVSLFLRPKVLHWLIFSLFQLITEIPILVLFSPIHPLKRRFKQFSCIPNLFLKERRSSLFNTKNFLGLYPLFITRIFSLEYFIVI